MDKNIRKESVAALSAFAAVLAVLAAEAAMPAKSRPANQEAEDRRRAEEDGILGPPVASLACSRGGSEGLGGA